MFTESQTLLTQVGNPDRFLGSKDKFIKLTKLVCPY